MNQTASIMASATILSPVGYPTARGSRPRESRVSRPNPLAQQISSGAPARNARLPLWASATRCLLMPDVQILPKRRTLRPNQPCRCACTSPQKNSRNGY